MIKKDRYWTYFDEAWKKVIEKLFPYLLSFFIPDLYSDFDLSKGFVFLDKELEKLSTKSKKGAKYVDKLAKISLKNGNDQWVLVHIEVQGYADSEFPERMFRYFYRIFDRYNEKIVSLALITGSDRSMAEGRFEFKAYGSGVEFRYLSPRLMDYDKIKLEQDDNPIALVVLASQEAEIAKKKGKAFDTKRRLIRMMYERGYNKDEVIALFEFIDWIIFLSDEEEDLIMDEIRETEEVNKMPYVTSAERIGLRRGFEKGIIEGKIEGKRELIIKALDERFNETPEDIVKSINDINDESNLDNLFRVAIRCKSLDEFKKHLGYK